MFISLDQITPFVRISSKEIILSTEKALGTKVFITSTFQLQVPEEGAGYVLPLDGKQVTTYSIKITVQSRF